MPWVTSSSRTLGLPKVIFFWARSRAPQTTTLRRKNGAPVPPFSRMHLGISIIMPFSIDGTTHDHLTANAIAGELKTYI